MLHAWLPAFSLNVPARHTVHEPDWESVYPGLHKHVLACAKLCVFAGQASHAASPLTFLKESAGQGVQAPPDPVMPSGQSAIQSSASLLPVAELGVSVGHIWQVFSNLAPTAAEYLPATQLAHALLDICAELTE